MIDLLNLTEEGLNANTAVELRKTGAELGIKGASKGKKADLIAAIMELVKSAKAEAAKAETPKTAKGKCIVCGVRGGMTAKTRQEQGLSKDFSDQCLPCYEEGGWENSHSDSGHDAILATPEAERTEEQTAEIDGCWICFPELNEAKRPAKAGRSRAGMEIVAKGSEFHKSETFRAAAEAKGWTVSIALTEIGPDQTRYVATATRGEDAVQLAWNGRAYDYPNSSARIGGKDRKVRNLKEALRLL